MYKVRNGLCLKLICDLFTIQWSAYNLRTDRCSLTPWKGIRNPEIFSCGIRTPALKKSGTSKNPDPTFYSSPSSDTNKESGIQYPESGIPGVESGIQDCPGFHYIGRAVKLWFTLLRYSGLREILYNIIALMHVDVRRANFTTKPRFEIGHFRVPKTLTFKMRLGTQPFLWKWVLFAWEWKMISISKAEHLPLFWNRGPGKLGNGPL